MVSSTRISDTMERIRTIIPYIPPCSLAAEIQTEALTEFLATYGLLLNEAEIIQITALMDNLTKPPDDNEDY